MSQKIVVQVDQELKDLIPTYLENRRVELAELKKLCASSDSKGITAITHKLKGNAAAYGFVRLGEIALQIETALKVNQWGEVKSLCDQIEGYLTNISIEFIEVKE